ncbi:MAG: bifunctional UDP-N-acetylglucosamine diphosphorylase/glucosamine-1-phosphate N-acetyltransferase GlmU [Cellvibrionaceae bacterium]|nr:bifunctional UDP-N-acetylglucosamine diphosphorylase/glucosamine-1-phosphate N-acetyltransferase GlmU [Cellvibrionaceae bacterium]
MLEVVILAAGKGTRMRSSLPKVLHKLAGKPFIEHVLDRSRDLNAEKVHLVVGHGAQEMQAALAGQEVNFIVQSPQLGTGHAVQQVMPHLYEGSRVLILYGDVPLIKTETLKALLKKVTPNSMGLLTVNLDKPQGYGRIVRGSNGNIVSIVEQKDASEEQLEIKEVNTGVMAVGAQHLLKWLPQLSKDNAQGEYYLTDIIALAVASDVQVLSSQASSATEVMGVNNRAQQAMLERLYQQEAAQQLMSSGATLADPARIDCRGSLSTGEDCFIDINCVFEGDVTLGNNVSIGPNCYLKDMVVGDNTEVYANCVLEASQIASNCLIGPFARIRPGTQLEDSAKLGNFVETKKAVVGKGSKVNHLSYVGDAIVGDHVNIGAGAITCNYDGANKHKTHIGDGVFIGSNTALVAPLSLGENVTVAAGSTVTRDVESQQLVVARTRQKNIAGWQRPVKPKND